MQERHRGKGAGTDERRASAEAAERPRIFLRATYALNPGIPHYVDFPPRER